MIVCKECGTEVYEETYSCGNGWDGLTKCPGCGIVEGETEEVDDGEDSR